MNINSMNIIIIYIYRQLRLKTGSIVSYHTERSKLTFSQISQRLTLRRTELKHFRTSSSKTQLPGIYLLFGHCCMFAHSRLNFRRDPPRTAVIVGLAKKRWYLAIYILIQIIF